MTNRERLSTLSTDEWYDTIMWLIKEYGKNYTDSRKAVIQWLDSECIVHKAEREEE